MNKTAIKNYAVWARNELIERVSRKAFEYGIEKDKEIDANLDSIGGRILTADEKRERAQLIVEVNQRGFDHVIEEVAYTWFNRFVALRFMEVNNYLPNKIRVFTDYNNEFKPQIIDEAMNLEFSDLSKEEIYRLLEANNKEELYKELIIATCNDMGKYLPGMFTSIADYKVLLFPDHLLNQGSVIERLISDIEEDSFNIEKEGQIEIIGWMYQFYNIEPKDKVFSRKKGEKIQKEDIPAATQLFTPDWIVRYMVENSLGRFWLEGHPKREGDSAPDLKENWKYYLEEAKQDEEVEEKLKEIRAEYAGYTPEMIKLIDPCMGSGHILVYAFDVLMQIYESYGYTRRDAAKSIVENNLYGIDIDERAYQLSYFAVMMKARQYDRRILTKGVSPNLYHIKSGEMISEELLAYFGDKKPVVKRLVESFKDASEYGSLLKPDVTLEELQSLEKTIDEILDMPGDINLLTGGYRNDACKEVIPYVRLAKVLVSKYQVVVTNPPYMPVSNGSSKLQDFVKKNYPNSKTDLFAVFMEKCKEMLCRNGLEAMINMHSWMFLSSYEKLRENLLSNATIVNMAHLGARAFEEIGGEVVQTTAFVLRNSIDKGYISSFKRLVDFNSQDEKEDAYLAEGNLYQTSTDNFSKIPGSPVAYWVSERFVSNFENGIALGTIADSKQGLATADNDRFLREWYEVVVSKIKFDARDSLDAENSKCKWFPYNKGGTFRKWYGNNDYVVNWENDGFEIKHIFDAKGKLRSRPQNTPFYFKESASWSLVTSSTTAFRYKPQGHIFDVAGMSLFSNNYLKYYLALCNTKIVTEILKVVAPTINYQCGDIANIPVIFNKEKLGTIEEFVKENIDSSKLDWDSFETSWDFTVHPLVKNHAANIADAYMLWKDECEDRFQKLKANEEELNRIFIDIYGLQDELTPDVEEKDVTVYRVFDKKEDIPETMGTSKYALTKSDVIKSFISYAVGCMFGRYSLDEEGLAYAGGDWDVRKYKTFIPDADNIIPICDDEYFHDDIANRFVQFVEKIYGKESLEDNLDFIASALGGKGTSRDVIRNYFLNDFYKDHCKNYQKRPIYWLFDSGKKNGFKALIYMHRYQPGLIARMRTQYVFEQQSRYSNQISILESQLNEDLGSSERVRVNKQLKAVKEQDDELRKYQEIVHHYADMMIDIDLDDGVKVNYEKFKDLLAKIN